MADGPIGAALFVVAGGVCFRGAVGAFPIVHGCAIDRNILAGWTIRPWITSVGIGLVGVPSNAGLAYTVIGGVAIERNTLTGRTIRPWRTNTIVCAITAKDNELAGETS